MTFLVATGWACMFAERSFSEGEGDFSRKKFGSAFHRSGLVVLASGLTLLLGGQLAWMVEGVLWYSAIPLVATDSVQKIWAMAIVLISAAGFLVEHFARRSKGQYMVVAVLLGAWAVVDVLDVCSIRPELGHIAIAIGLLTIVAKFVAGRFGKQTQNSTDQTTGNEQVRQWLQSAVAISAGLGVLAFAQFAGQFFSGSGNWLFSPVSWVSVAQMIVTTIVKWTTSFRITMK